MRGLVSRSRTGSPVRSEGWRSPLYRTQVDGRWFEHTLSGTWPVDSGLPVTHVTLYEADASATWARKRLSTEFEWEHAVRSDGRPPSGPGP